MSYSRETESEDEENQCLGSAWGKSPRDPSFNPGHDFNDAGKCRQCGLQLEREE